MEVHKLLIWLNWWWFIRMDLIIADTSFQTSPHRVGGSNGQSPINQCPNSPVVQQLGFTEIRKAVTIQRSKSLCHPWLFFQLGTTHFGGKGSKFCRQQEPMSKARGMCSIWRFNRWDSTGTQLTYRKPSTFHGDSESPWKSILVTDCDTSFVYQVGSG